MPTAQSILDAGEFLFPRQGFHGTSMRQLARFAGITPSAIYNHFPSKEEIFIGLLKARLPHRTLAEAVREAEGASAEEMLYDGVRRMHAAMGGRLENLRLIFVEVLEFEGRHLPLVMPEMMAPALSFIERLRAAEPRLQRWSPSFILRLLGGGFFAFAVTESYLRGLEGFTGGPQDYDDLAAVLAAGLLGAADRLPRAGEAP
jgi:AcrR family transcriptional regulator